MRYSEGKDAEEIQDFSLTNDLAQRVDKLRTIYGDIHKLPIEEFEKLYVPRTANHLMNAGILSDITQVSICTWTDFLDKTESGDPIDNEFLDPHSLEGKVIQLVSPVSTGKTTYINYLIKAILPKILPAEVTFVPIIFDMRGLNINNQNIDKVLFNFINTSIEDSFDIFCKEREDFQKFKQTTHKVELEIFADIFALHGIEPEVSEDKGIHLEQRKLIMQKFEEDPTAFLDRKIKYVSKFYNAFFLLIVDNIDQHAHLSPSHVIFTLNQLAEFKNISSIITLRDTTHRANIASEVAVSYQRAKTFFLSKLELADMGSKRLRATKRMVVKDLSPKNVIVKFIDHVLSYDQNYKKKVGARSPHPSSFDYSYIWNWINRISNGDLRDVLYVLAQTLESNHLTSPEFTRMRANGVMLYGEQNDLNIKRFKTALINGSLPFYYEKYSDTFVLNLFDHDKISNKYHYLFRLKVLQLLVKLKHFKIIDIYSIFETSFANENHIENDIKKVLTAFLFKNLIAIEDVIKDGAFQTLKSKDDIDIDHYKEAHCFVTPNGHFHLQFLVKDDIYLDEMKYSTNLSNDNYQKIFSQHSQNHAPGRKESTSIFIDLLMDEEKKHMALSQNLGVPLIIHEIREAHEERKAIEDYYKKNRMR